MKKKLMLRAFSLMEMMIVLLIVAIIAAASAPMIAKKMMRQTGTGDSPWVFTGTGNSVAFNMRGSRVDTVLIGTDSVGNGAQSAPLYIRTPEDAANIPDGNAISFALNNQVVGHLGITDQNVYMSNIIPEALGNGNDGAVIIGNLQTDRQRERNNGGTNADNTIGNKVVVGYQNVLDIDDPNHTSQDTIIGQHIHLALSGNNADPLPVMSANQNTVIGTDISRNNAISPALPIRNTTIIGQNIHPQARLLTRCTFLGNGITTGNNNNNNITSAIAVGSAANVRADDTIAIGSSASAQNADAIAIGNNAGGNNGSGLRSVAIGSFSAAGGQDSIAIGGGTGIQANDSRTVASQTNAIAIGNSARATAQNAIAIGSSTQAAHNNSVAIGVDAQTSGNNQIMLGSNGQNGRVTAPTVVIPGTLRLLGNTLTIGENNINLASLTSDIRLKNVGEKLTSGLEDIKKLEFFNYTFKDDKDQKPHVGVMAQDLQKVFPISVTEGSDGYLRIRWDEMFYAALNAIKELDSKITEIKTKVASYFDRVAKLEAQIDEQQQTIAELQKQNAEFKKRLAKIEKRGVGVKGVNNKIKTPALKSESEAE